MRWLGYAWDLAAWFFLISVASASLIGLVRKARARGKRLFASEPAARVDALKADTTDQFIYDA